MNAADFGTAMHRVLERLDFENPRPFMDKILHDCFYRHRAKDLNAARKMLNGFIASSVFKQLRKAKVLKKEISFVLNERHGLIHGVVDVFFQDEAGDWHILDYKTGFGSDEKIRQVGYDLQIKIYAVAAYEILKVMPRTGVVYFLGNHWKWEKRFDAKLLASYVSEVRDLQEKILDFSHRGAGAAEPGS